MPPHRFPAESPRNPVLAPPSAEVSRQPPQPPPSSLEKPTFFTGCAVVQLFAAGPSSFVLQVGVYRCVITGAIKPMKTAGLSNAESRLPSSRLGKSPRNGASGASSARLLEDASWECWQTCCRVCAPGETILRLVLEAQLIGKLVLAGQLVSSPKVARAPRARRMAVQSNTLGVASAAATAAALTFTPAASLAFAPAMLSFTPAESLLGESVCTAAPAGHRVLGVWGAWH
jgi:hypothetical protein